MRNRLICSTGWVLTTPLAWTRCYGDATRKVKGPSHSGSLDHFGAIIINKYHASNVDNNI